MCDFDVSWSETAGDLTSVRINIDAVFDNIGGLAGSPHTFFGLTGGPLASDTTLGGCGDTQCIVAGFWQSDLAAVPEPMSAVLLITGLLGTCFASRSRLNASIAVPSARDWDERRLVYMVRGGDLNSHLLSDKF
jgi:hypothetical protein